MYRNVLQLHWRIPVTLTITSSSSWTPVGSRCACICVVKPWCEGHFSIASSRICLCLDARCIYIYIYIGSDYMRTDARQFGIHTRHVPLITIGKWFTTIRANACIMCPVCLHWKVCRVFPLDPTWELHLAGILGEVICCVRSEVMCWDETYRANTIKNCMCVCEAPNTQHASGSSHL